MSKLLKKIQTQTQKVFDGVDEMKNDITNFSTEDKIEIIDDLQEILDMVNDKLARDEQIRMQHGI